MNYRKIWSNHYGPIPIDDNGRSYEIHHIDGDRTNNNIENLQCVSIIDHFNIHLNQNDLLAAAAIFSRMKIDKDYQKILNSEAGKQAFILKKGIHSLSKEERRLNSSKGGKANTGSFWFTDGTKNYRMRSNDHDLVKGRTGKYGFSPGKSLGVFWNNGTENIRSATCPGEEWSRGLFLTSDQQRRRVEIAKSIRKTDDQKRNISKKLQGIKRKIHTCPYCGKVGGGGAMMRFHFHNCKDNV